MLPLPLQSWPIFPGSGPYVSGQVSSLSSLFPAFLSCPPARSPAVLPPWPLVSPRWPPGCAVLPGWRRSPSPRTGLGYCPRGQRAHYCIRKSRKPREPQRGGRRVQNGPSSAWRLHRQLLGGSGGNQPSPPSLQCRGTSGCRAACGLACSGEEGSGMIGTDVPRIAQMGKLRPREGRGLAERQSPDGSWHCVDWWPYFWFPSQRRPGLRMSQGTRGVTAS